MTETLYNRRCRLDVYERVGGEGRSWSDVRIAFKVEKKFDREPNRVSVTVYNLNESSREFLSGDGLRLVLRAGYGEGEPPVVAVADIGEVTHERRGADRVTTIDAGDGEGAYLDAFVGASIGPGSVVDDAIRIVTDIASEHGVTVDPERIRSLPVVSRLQGWSFEGTATDALDELTSAMNVDWSIQDGEIRFVSAGGFDESMGVTLKPSTGLVGTPKRTRDGWEVVALMQPSILPRSRVRIDSEVVSGWFVVGDVAIDGDTHGSAWYVTAEMTDA